MAQCKTFVISKGWTSVYALGVSKAALDKEKEGAGTRPVLRTRYVGRKALGIAPPQ
jgi:hypothetical protein|eukprot:CAMPEP_0174354208 /NCGR_PEP_ID=MMETSP0811_2-20130205/18946_1 /TAXON_ID=73025 ORGANISM="Eutreptiella gymnastica-like, Strain CCMP1594" /NCGR_SAMPLE_ID=MMETSP0811_2 /ASSEMBLY_ACC=CAM_ASM_000667 /LENGTH=55 /DNA_ID=CAMNT_0015485005 /DNA_START=875 /DNA_END=1042 /DNA_ORIENTATION=-